jgi:hypothetical protein
MTTMSSMPNSEAPTGDPVLDRVWIQIAGVLGLTAHDDVTGAR